MQVILIMRINGNHLYTRLVLRVELARQTLQGTLLDSDFHFGYKYPILKILGQPSSSPVGQKPNENTDLVI